MPRPPLGGTGGLGGYGRRFPRDLSKVKFDPKKRGQAGTAGALAGGAAGAIGAARRVPRAAEEAVNARFGRFSQTAREMSLPETAASRRTKQIHEQRRTQALRRAADRGRISKGAKNTIARAAAGYAGGAAIGERLARPLGRRAAVRALARGKTAEQADARELAIRAGGAYLGGPPGALAAVRFGKGYLPELPLGNVPRQAYHQSHGLVRVLAYHGEGRFTVLTKHDEKTVVHRSALSFRRDVGKSDRDRQRGSAMAGAGAVTAGTGLVAGGVPGVREPNSLRIWLIRGQNAKARVSPRNALYNGRQVAPQPRAGILGFRANIHDSYIAENKHKTDRSSYVRGMREGKLKAEHGIVRGMRMGRKATYPLTLGGAALTAAGLRRRNRGKVGKADRRHGAAAGAGGAAGAGTLGAYAGLRTGAEIGVAATNRRIRREHTPGEAFSTGDRMVRRIKGLERGVKIGTVTGATGAGYAGYQAARGHKVQKDASDRRDTSAALVGGGLTTAAVGDAAPRGLRRFERRYANSARAHTLEAQRLAPHFGGLKVRPAQHGPFGEVRRPEKVTMYPERSDRELRESKAANKIRGGAQTKAQVGHHRGVAAQERHFAEVFDSTARAVRRARGPGLALAGAGATGLWASQGRKGTKAPVAKAQYGYMDRKRSPVKTAEMLAGLGLLAHGGSRLKMLGPAAAKGVRLADERGAGKEARAALELARALGTKTREVTGRGEDQLRRIEAFDRAVRSVPASLRPEITTAAGAMLAMHAHPTSHERFTPIGRA